MNKAEILKDIKDLMGDLDPMQVIPDESFDDAIHFAQYDLANKLGLTYVETEGLTFNADAIVDLPASLVKPVRIWYDDTPLPMPPDFRVVQSTYPFSLLDEGIGTVWGNPIDDNRYQFITDSGSTDFSNVDDYTRALVLFDPGTSTVEIVASMAQPLNKTSGLPVVIWNPVDTTVFFAIDTVFTAFPAYHLIAGSGYGGWFRLQLKGDAIANPTQPHLRGTNTYFDFSVRITNGSASVDIPFRYFQKGL